MKTLPLSEVKTRLSALVHRVQDLDDEVSITVNGRSAAVLLSQDRLDSLRETLDILSDPKLMRQFRRNVRLLKSGRGKWYTMEEVFGE